MNAQDLKNSILQLAVQGKLVEQRPEEGTAKELLAQIKAEKEQLIKDKKIKREKSLPEIAEDEKLFEIPKSWEWVRLDDLSTVITKGTTPRGGNVAYLDSGIGFLRAENVVGYDKLSSDNLKCIDEETHNGFLKRSIIQEDDVLITIAGTLGRTGLVRKENLPLNANQAVAIVRLVNSTAIDLKYLIYALNAPETQNVLVGQKKITAIPNLTLEIIQMCCLPIPPLAEQKRIVTKIEELLPYIEQYDKAYTKLEAFNKKFPEDMKKSILQMAMQGKLVEQRPEEGTADELYVQIVAEKARLIKEGKIKKEKPIDKVLDDDIPWGIPDSWKWVRFCEVTISRDAERIPLSVSEREKLAKEYDYYGASGVIDKVDKYLFDEDLLLIGEDGANLLNRSTPIAFIARGKYWVNNHAHVLGCITGMDMEYLTYYINSISLAKYVTGTAQPKMNQARMNGIWIPLPPLAEQKRIVAKLEQMLPYCDQLIK